MNRIAKAIDRADERFGRRYGFDQDATYVVVGTPTEDPVTFIEKANEKPTPNITVREQPLTLRDVLELSQAGLELVETSFYIRTACVTNVSPDDEIELSDTGQRYIVTGRPIRDELKLRWRVFVREKRF